METELNIFEAEEGKFCLTITETDDATYDLFEEMELQGGGYTWEGIVNSLINIKMPNLLQKLEMGAEADNMYVYCNEREQLVLLKELALSATKDHSLLIKAINAAEEIE